MSPPPNWVNCSRDEPGPDDELDLVAERLVDDRHQRAPDREADGDRQELRPLGPPRPAEQARSSWRTRPGARPRRTAAGSVWLVDVVALVELEERLLEVGRLDRQVRDRETRDRGQERPDVALELARQQAVVARRCRSPRRPG